MTTDDDMREIEAALDEFARLSEQRYRGAIAKRPGPQVDVARTKLLTLIRQKLPQTDAEHERAVEEWRGSVTSILSNPEVADDVWLINKQELDEALRLMRARGR